jgi:glycosyltransferase involved in cell wall biosynthesis
LGKLSSQNKKPLFEVGVTMNMAPYLKQKVIIVMPAYNAELTLEKTVNDIPAGSYDEIILVDDASRDNTVELSKKLGLCTIKHEKNLGYGGNQKTCYKNALARDADIVVMLHPDFQYDARLVPYMTGLIREGVCDVILGSRIRTRREALKGGMPIYKYFMNRALTLFENMILGIAVSETHTGYRAFSRKVLETVPFEKNSNDFVFDNQIIAQMQSKKLIFGEISCPTKYFEEASSINFRRSVKYGLGVLGTSFWYRLHAWGIYNHPIFRG